MIVHKIAKNYDILIRKKISVFSYQNSQAKLNNPIDSFLHEGILLLTCLVKLIFMIWNSSFRSMSSVSWSSKNICFQQNVEAKKKVKNYSSVLGFRSQDLLQCEVTLHNIFHQHQRNKSLAQSVSRKFKKIYFGGEKKRN
jgi:hypothetical protein